MHLRDERGFTMVTFMGVMFVVVAIVFTSYAIADGDLGPGKNDEDRKIAYAAAEAGIQSYLFQLIQNDDYWAGCTNVPEPHAVNQRWDGTGADTRTKWRTVPGSTASYAIELLPANGQAACVPGSADSMIDASSRTMRIRATGRTTVGAGSVRRSIVATLRRQSFLDYIYFTDLETPAPATYAYWSLGLPTLENPATTTPAPPQRNLIQWSAETCGRYYNAGRSGAPGAAPRFVGDAINNAGARNSSGTWQDFEHGCDSVRFFGQASASDGDQAPTAADFDSINGPLHTNDEILVCGHPRFGRNPQDRIEVSAPGRPLTASETADEVGWRAPASDCAGSEPNVNFPSQTKARLGTWLPNAPTLALPTSNSALRTDAPPSFRFVGRTIVRLENDRVRVTGKLENGTVYADTSLLMPADGAVYVSNASGCATYQAFPPYASAPPPGTGCGDLEIEGTYTRSITFGADNDIVVKDDVVRAPSADVLLGLIANNFVRIWHPVTDDGDGECTNAGGPAPDLRIDGVILSVANSFMHDFWFCGGPTGTLTVEGAIGQKYRGAVGTQSADGATISNGYTKNYSYDDRLRFRSPPHFIDPVNAGWRTQTYAEQIPAR